MNFTFEFGKCLELLLTTLDISSNRLSRAINVDSSLVYRWIKGKRIPPYDSTYIEIISDYLSHNILNSIQEKGLYDLFSKIPQIDNSMSIKDKIKISLLEAQGNSLALRSSAKNSTDDFINADSHISFNVAHKNNLITNSKKSELYLDDKNISDFNLSKEDTIITGSNEIIMSIVLLLESTAATKSEDNNKIYFSYNSDFNILEINPPLFDRLAKAVLRLIKSGWYIICLFRPNSNHDRTVNFISYIFTMLLTGRLFLYSYKSYDTLTMGKELFIISNKAAISCYNFDDGDNMDSAFCLRNIHAINIMKCHFETLISKQAQLLLKNITNVSDNEFIDLLIQNEKKIGAQYLYNNSFGLLSLPSPLYEKLLEKTSVSAKDKLELIKLHTELESIFLSNLENASRTEIYKLYALDSIILEKNIRLFYGGNSYITPIDINDVITHLEYLIYLLEKYDNYNIAFRQPNTIDSLYPGNIFCLIKERGEVLMELVIDTREHTNLRIYINEPTIVKSLEELSKKSYSEISPLYKEKSEVIKFLKSRIDFLKKGI